MSELFYQRVAQLRTDEDWSRKGRETLFEKETTESRNSAGSLGRTSSGISHRAYGRRSWVLLDRDWARQLGVMRTAGGVYRIGRHELMRKLATLKLATVSTQNGLIEAAVPGNFGIERAEVFAGLCDIA